MAYSVVFWCILLCCLGNTNAETLLEIGQACGETGNVLNIRISSLGGGGAGTTEEAVDCLIGY